MITDCGSFLAEYLPTKKPIMLLVNPKSSGYNEIGEKLVSSYYKAYKNNDIKDFIDNIVLNGNDYMLSNRVDNLCLVQPNKEGAGKFIVNLIDHKLSEQYD